MRSPSDVSPPRRVSLGKFSRRFWTGLIVAVLFVLFISLRNLSVLWTDQMWFSSVHLSNVFSTLLFIKVGLGIAFGAVFFLLMWGNLLLTDRYRARDLSFTPEDEVVRRFQNAVRPYAKRIYAAIAFFLAIIAGLNATGQWNNYLLFANSKNFGVKDAQFHKDISFYVFTLPFLKFVVTWALVSLIFVLIITAGFHYLNGGIKATRTRPRVSPKVKAHLSVIGAGIALFKALGYVLAKFELVNSTNGFVQGAGYTDVHARIPALTILFYLSLASAIILLANVRSRGWSLPAVAVGLWVFVALIIGVLYPTLLQTLKVSPNQDTLESPYIQRDIAATRLAYGINKVDYQAFAGSSTITSSEIKADTPTLNNIRLWDPASSIALTTTIKRQSIHSYYTFTSLSVDRYKVNGTLSPVLIGVRQLNTSGLPSQNWVNEHLQYTHGEGVAALAANQENVATGNPNYVVSNVPTQSSNGLPQLRQAGIYFAPNDGGWVVANTKQAELDYQVDNGPNAGQPVETHYQGTGGVRVGNIFSRTALALRLGDFNFLISNQITSNSRVLFVRDIKSMAKKAAPFLSFDSQPYAVINNGEVNYVLDGYTTTDQYPYSENNQNFNVNPGGLPGSFNYVRNSVKVVINAYSGAMTFYANDPKDPILEAYESAFPGMFKSMKSMSQTLKNHLRYPQDIFSVQASVLGKYHISSPSAFFNASDAWEVTPTTGAGNPSSALATNTIINAAGQIISQTNTPMSPLFQVGALPGDNQQQLLEQVEFVPAGNSSTVQGLTAFLVATSNQNNYGQLKVYETPRGTSVTGPVQADSEIQQNAKASQLITLLDQNGSSVLLGNNLMVPLDQSVLYIRPLYVTSTANPLPQLKYVIAVFNQDVSIEPTLAGVLSDVLGANVNAGSTTSSSTSASGTTSKTGQTAQYYLSQASADYAAAQSALAAGNLGKYQSEVNAMNTQLGLAQKALGTK